MGRFKVQELQLWGESPALLPIPKMLLTEVVLKHHAFVPQVNPVRVPLAYMTSSLGKICVEICFWHYRSITHTIDFLLALVLIAISKPPYNIGTIEHTSLLFFSSLCYCLLPTVDLLAIFVSLSTVDSLGSSLSTEKSIKQLIILLVTQPVPKPSFRSHCFNNLLSSFIESEFMSFGLQSTTKRTKTVG